MIRDSIPADPIVPAPHEVRVALRRLAAINDASGPPSFAASRRRRRCTPPCVPWRKENSLLSLRPLGQAHAALR
jgi:hypothetical protein